MKFLRKVSVESSIFKDWSSNCHHARLRLQKYMTLLILLFGRYYKLEACVLKQSSFKIFFNLDLETVHPFVLTKNCFMVLNVSRVVSNVHTVPSYDGVDGRLFSNSFYNKRVDYCDSNLRYGFRQNSSNNSFTFKIQELKKLNVGNLW